MLLFFTFSVLLVLASLNIEHFFDDEHDPLKFYTAEMATRMSTLQWVILAYVTGTHLAMNLCNRRSLHENFLLCGVLRMPRPGVS